MKAIKKILVRHDGSMSVIPTFGRLGGRIMSSRPVLELCTQVPDFLSLMLERLVCPG